MICPRCGAEHHKDARNCPSCKPPVAVSDAQEDDVEYRTVIFTSNLGDIALIKSLLDAENIPYFVEGENFNHLSPWIEPTRFIVRQEDFEKARDVLSNFDADATGDDASQ